MLNQGEIFSDGEEGDRRLDRRRFLGVAACAALLAIAGEWAGQRTGEAAPLDLEVPASLPPGGVHEVATANGREALVVRLADGEVVGFDRRCPHLGCPVVWSGERQRFECPCHHAAFEARTGRVLFGPPRRGLQPAKIRLVEA